VEVVVPEEYMGPVNGDLISRRGRIGRHEILGTTQIIKAWCRCRKCSAMRPSCVPHAGPRQFYDALRQYEEVPKNIAEEIVSKVQGKVTR
jgi:elongation factor G